MKRSFVVGVGPTLVFLLLGAIPVACFSLKEPPCAFSCLQPPNRCPENYTCEADGLCHHHGATESCFLTAPGDAGADVSATLDAGDATD
jgi:hypothetical protein